ncbi:endonuclease/exonuclease/phosphatase family protein [Pseudozobellia sp. WGM2]|uniref:endonuclease/exonuclease/phosphatase family protein n=1 Tax=Pseudozobellia sp. WGM2 TaxID=2787625 RepID=UPI001ADF2160|nr:endonuclease/exonuclease/phosphatase family protein [Pseudozobellia sp. WGM2]
MKIATFNIQNLFHRHRDLVSRSRTKNATDWISELDCLLRKPNKSIDDSERINNLSFLLGFEKTEDSPYAILKRRAGELCFKGKVLENTTKASFLTDWQGWTKLGNRPIHEKAIFSKAYMIAETNPDILVLQEVENRASLMEFNSEFLPLLKIKPYQEVMVFETNDNRDLGMGILLKDGYHLNGFKNHLHDLDEEGYSIFDIDCQEYEIITPNGNAIWVMNNHFSAEEGQRQKQAQRVSEIYKQKLRNGKDLVIVSGTLNDVSYSHCLAPLLQETDLIDVSKHKRFTTDRDNGTSGNYFSLGAYRMGVNIKQKDYLMLSPKLFEMVANSGMNRMGTWPERKPKWRMYASIASKEHAASEHPLIWADFN